MDHQRSIRDRYPPPWSVEQTEGGHFAVVSCNGVRLAFVYVGHPTLGGLKASEARAIALEISKLADSPTPTATTKATP
jgi:hypothetical protein